MTSTARWSPPGFRCVAMDRRGHGRTDVPGTGYDINTLADDLAGLVEHLDLRGVIVVAHSMGTCEATRWLARPATDRVARAAFLGSMTPHLAGAVGEALVEARSQTWSPTVRSGSTMVIAARDHQRRCPRRGGGGSGDCWPVSRSCSGSAT